MAFLKKEGLGIECFGKSRRTSPEHPGAHVSLRESQILEEGNVLRRISQGGILHPGTIQERQDKG